jgi:hypothetical protein
LESVPFSFQGLYFATYGRIAVSMMTWDNNSKILMMVVMIRGVDCGCRCSGPLNYLIPFDSKIVMVVMSFMMMVVVFGLLHYFFFLLDSINLFYSPSSVGLDLFSPNFFLLNFLFNFSDFSSLIFVSRNYAFVLVCDYLIF